MQDSGGADDSGGGDGGGGSTGSGGVFSVNSGNEVPVELAEDELSPPQPVEPSTAISARNIHRHRGVNPPGKECSFLLFKIGIFPN